MSGNFSGSPFGARTATVKFPDTGEQFVVTLGDSYEAFVNGMEHLKETVVAAKYSGHAEKPE